ncbi:MAG TPA: hypothetical protein VFM81_09660 [Actinomycetota bacterium]|nr:hypothetical protein [Actinomycetota bacterium]
MSSRGPNWGAARSWSWAPVELAAEQPLRAEDVRIPWVEREHRIAVTDVSG